jgi:hypothetical protein
MEEEDKLLCDDCEKKLGLDDGNGYDPLEVEGERRARGVILCQLCKFSLTEAWRDELSPE